MWNILAPSLMACVVGLFLFLELVPRFSGWLWTRVNASRIEEFQKLRILNLLDWVRDGQLARGQQPKSVNVLALSLFVLMGFQHYFMFIHDGYLAATMVTGMFGLIIVYMVSH